MFTEHWPQAKKWEQVVHSFGESSAATQMMLKSSGTFQHYEDTCCSLGWEALRHHLPCLISVYSQVCGGTVSSLGASLSTQSKSATTSATLSLVLPYFFKPSLCFLYFEMFWFMCVFHAHSSTKLQTSWKRGAISVLLIPESPGLTECLAYSRYRMNICWNEMK